MLGMALRLLRPSYALTALMLFGAWQGYSFVKSIPERLPALTDIRLVQGRPPANGSEHAIEDPPESQLSQDKPVVQAVRRIHPLLRVVYWLVGYVLLCFGSVPLIKRGLGHESNLVNAAMLVGYSGVGVLAAMALTGFRFSWWTVLWMVMALVCSGVLIVLLAGELEKIRLEDRCI